jgi:3-hydroxy acid dehydrogenase / malonic semialdehyde reductase
MKTVFVTGATSGIGRATTYLLAKEGYRLIICGRRSERLESIYAELSSGTDILPLCFDVRNREEIEKTIKSLPPEWTEIDILINNAGNAHGLAPIHEGSIDDWDAMLDGNVKGLLYISKAILPGMVERKHGHIINIGSISGKEVYPGGAVYCASKFAVDAITQGMRIDLSEHNIKVSAINPGLVNTEFSLVRFKGDKNRADNVYKGMNPLFADDIAEIILFMISRPLHVNIADLLVLPIAQSSAVRVHRTE